MLDKMTLKDLEKLANAIAKERGESSRETFISQFWKDYHKQKALILA